MISDEIAIPANLCDSLQGSVYENEVNIASAAFSLERVDSKYIRANSRKDQL